MQPRLPRVSRGEWRRAGWWIGIGLLLFIGLWTVLILLIRRLTADELATKQPPQPDDRGDLRAPVPIRRRAAVRVAGR